jgi:putative ATP-binding cassette transporter
MMELEEVVRFDSQKKSIDNKLSMGQRKRLALIYALMEKRDVMVLDEWAAEQDPHFRAYFYEQIIPVLKQMNKTVIAVTHDDKYYGQADRILHFDFGKVAKDVKLQHAKQPELVK